MAMRKWRHYANTLLSGPYSLLPRFILAVIPLFLLWQWAGPVYVTIIAFLAQRWLGFVNLPATFDEMQLHILVDNARMTMDLAGTQFVDFNIVPLFALILATQARWRRKLKWVVIGTGIAAFVHSTVIFAQAQAQLTTSAIYGFINNISVVFNPLLPFLLWLILTDTLFPAASTQDS